MEFDILGWDADVRIRHIILMALVPFGIPFLSSAIGLLYALFSGLDIAEGFYNLGAILGPFFGIFLLPLVSFVSLYLAPDILKMKNDPKTCRSLASAYVLCWGLGLGILSLAVQLSYGFLPGEMAYALLYFPISSMNTIFNAAVSAIILYLWLLIFLKPERKRLEAAIAPSVLFALLAVAVQYSIAYLLTSRGIYPLLGYELAGATYFFLDYLVLAFPIIIFMADKRLGKGAYLFSLFYLLPFVTSLPLDAVSQPLLLFELGLRISHLAFLYLITQRSFYQPFKT